MRLGKISLELAYVVDLDNQDMVNHAKDAILEDITQMVFKGGSAEALAAMDVKEDAALTEGDIPEFLKDCGELELDAEEAIVG